jgi:hypothetical protein
VRYIPKHINERQNKMTENEYNETFDMQMEREHQQTVARMREFQMIGEQISKMPVVNTRTLEIEVRYLMGIISELEAMVKNLESETRRLEQLVHRVTN